MVKKTSWQAFVPYYFPLNGQKNELIDRHLFVNKNSRLTICFWTLLKVETKYMQSYKKCYSEIFPIWIQSELPLFTIRYNTIGLEIRTGSGYFHSNMNLIWIFYISLKSSSDLVKSNSYCWLFILGIFEKSRSSSFKYVKWKLKSNRNVG